MNSQTHPCKDFLQFTIGHMQYNKANRKQELVDTLGTLHELPVETDWKTTIKPGQTIQLGTYTHNHKPCLVIRNVLGEEIGHYGPDQMLTRDAYYKSETSKKASDLIREEQIRQAAENYQED